MVDILRVSSITTALCLSACASVPKEGVYQVQTSDVVANIRCELRDAVWGHEKLAVADGLTDADRQKYLDSIESRFAPWFQNEAVTMNLTVKVLQTDAATANASFVIPIMPTSLATLSLEGGHSTKATRTESFNFDDAVADGTDKNPIVNGKFRSGSPSFYQGTNKDGRLTEEVDPGIKLVPSLKYTTLCPPSRRYGPDGRLLAGNLGLREFLERIDSTVRASTPERDQAPGSMAKSEFKPQKLSYTVDFAIAANSGAGPQFTLIPLGTNTFGGGFKLDSRRTDTHTLVMTSSRLQSYSDKLPVTAVLPPPRQRRGAFQLSPDSNIPRENRIENQGTITRELLREIDPRTIQ